MSRLSVENSLSHSGEKSRSRALRCVTYFGYRKSLCFSRLCHNFPSKFFFVSQYRKTLHGNHSVLCFRKFLVAKEFMDKKASINFFRRRFFVSVPKIFVGEPFSVSLISGIEKVFASDGYVTIFHRKFFVSQCQKIS